MLLKELTGAQNEFSDNLVVFIVNDDILNIGNFIKYRDCRVISWELLRNYTIDGFRVMNVIVEVK